MKKLVGLVFVAAATLGLWGCRPGCTDERGVHHNHGDKWICADGCNHCACSNGDMSSTDMLCGGGGAGGEGNDAGIEASAGGDAG